MPTDVDLLLHLSVSVIVISVVAVLLPAVTSVLRNEGA